MYASDQPLTLHAALYRIAEETVSGSDLPTFYAAMHSIVAQLMFAANFISPYTMRRRTPSVFPILWTKMTRPSRRVPWSKD